MKRGRKQLPHVFVGDTECKWCSGCAQHLPLDRFAKASPGKRSTDGLNSRCRVCVRARDNAWEAQRKANGIKAKTCIPPGTQWVRIAALADGRRKPCRLYNIFDAMHKRCYSPSRWEYDVYGGRGVRVCEEWYHNYPAFRAWAVANGYRKHLTLDRYPDGKGDYGPTNCRWATREEQTYNTKAVIKLTLNGVTKILPVWARELGLRMETMRTRRRKGWTDEQILTTPTLTNGHYRPGVQHKPRGRRPNSAQSSVISASPSPTEDRSNG